MVGVAGVVLCELCGLCLFNGFDLSRVLQLFWESAKVQVRYLYE